MKKIILLLIVFFNLFPCMKNGKLILGYTTEIRADGEGFFSEYASLQPVDGYDYNYILSPDFFDGKPSDYFDRMENGGTRGIIEDWDHKGEGHDMTYLKDTEGNWVMTKYDVDS